MLVVHPLIACTLGLQKSAAQPGQSALSRITKIASDMWRQEGVKSFYKGITPRVLRVAPGETISVIGFFSIDARFPGQAVVFAVYERVRRLLEQIKPTEPDESYSE